MRARRKRWRCPPMTNASRRATCSTCSMRGASSRSPSGRLTSCGCAISPRHAAKRGAARREGGPMPELLLELFSEEIPARMQAKAAQDLKTLVTNALVEAGLLYEGAQAHATPRRLVLGVEGLAAKAADVSEERKGPRIDAPEQAVQGFLKSTGLTIDQLKMQDDKRGQFYIAV